MKTAAETKPWLPVAIERAAGKLFRRFDWDRVAIDYGGRTYASECRAAFLVQTRLARAPRRVAGKQAVLALGKRRRPKALLPAAKTYPHVVGDVRRCERIAGHSFDARYLAAIRSLYGPQLTFDVYSLEGTDVLRLYRRGVLVAAVTRLRVLGAEVSP